MLKYTILKDSSIKQIAENQIAPYSEEKTFEQDNIEQWKQTAMFFAALYADTEKCRSRSSKKFNFFIGCLVELLNLHIESDGMYMGRHRIHIESKNEEFAVQTIANYLANNVLVAKKKTDD